MGRDWLSPTPQILHGADVGLSNQEGNTPLDLAQVGSGCPPPATPPHPHPSPQADDVKALLRDAMPASSSVASPPPSSTTPDEEAKVTASKSNIAAKGLTVAGAWGQGNPDDL